MVLSMTGFGRAKATYQDKNITVELKALNGKISDVRCRIPANYKDKEIELRNMVLQKALRGKIDFLLTIGGVDGDGEYTINKQAFLHYFKEIKDLQKETGIQDEGDITQSILRIPNVITTPTDEVPEEEWKVVVKTIESALNNLHDFRTDEGKILHDDLALRNQNIKNLQSQIAEYEEARIQSLRDRFSKNLKEFFSSEQIDRNRYEQEIIYYIEKLDIHEEKVRLEQHCIYFEDILKNESPEVGKKLGFIAQEMGREINTLGAKAQDKNIQRIVVNMKDELEKIKEQLANVI